MVLGGVAVVVAFGFYACSGHAPPAKPAAVEATSAPPPKKADTAKRPHVGEASASNTAPDCPDAAIGLVARPTMAAIPEGGYLTIEVTLTNTSAVPCVRDVGSKAQEVQVRSGGERLWSSDDCAGVGDAGKRSLQPGEVVTSRVTWDGKASTSGCKSGSSTVPAGKYQVVARCGELWSKPAEFAID